MRKIAPVDDKDKDVYIERLEKAYDRTVGAVTIFTIALSTVGAVFTNTLALVASFVLWGILAQAPSSLELRVRLQNERRTP